MQCTTCKSEMRLVPAGVSKNTGRPYNAFWACDNKCPKPSAVQKKTDQYEKVIDYKSEKIGEAQSRNEAGIRVSQMVNIAGMITAAMIQHGSLAQQDWKLKFDEVAKWVGEYRDGLTNQPPF